MVFGGLGMLLHNRLAPESEGVWLPTEGEVLGVAEPLSRILERHFPVGAAIAGDASDAIDAGVAAASWGIRSGQEQVAYNAARKGAETNAQQAEHAQ